MRFGIARDLITPDIVTHLAGYASFRDHFFQGIHDDLYVKSVLMDDGKSQMLLIALDLLMYEHRLTEEIADYTHEQYGIDYDHILISHTHTHAGPAIAGYDIGLASPKYEAFLLARITSCIDRTFANLFQGQIALGSVAADWSVNRRLKIGGKVEMRPNPEGITDNSLHILKICDLDNKIRGLLLNYGCHPVTLRDQSYLSAEYPGRLCQLLETRFYGCTALFFQGAGGNSRPKVGDRAPGQRAVHCPHGG